MWRIVGVLGLACGDSKPSTTSLLPPTTDSGRSEPVDTDASTIPVPTDGSTPVTNDQDADGYDADVDCADDDPAVHPGAEEIADGIDNDCDPATCVATGFAETATAWALPATYGNDAAPLPFQSTGQAYNHCSNNSPAYSTLDLTGDGIRDLVVTVEPCAPLPTGDTEWHVYPGGPGGFADTYISLSLPEVYGNEVAPLPFQSTSYAYNHCSNNWPAYSTFDLTGDAIPDLVVTMEPCAELPVGDTEWRVYSGGADGFADTSIAWSLPATYGNKGAPFPFQGTSYAFNHCSNHWPSYSTFDLTGDAIPDLVVTMEPCAELPTGDTEWRVYPGGVDGFADTSISWTLPEGYGNDAAPHAFQSTSYAYSHCSNNWPAYTTFDLTADGWLDLVVTLEPCAPLPTGDTEWHVYAGGTTGFAAVPTAWALPDTYGNEPAPLPFQAINEAYNHCGNNRPAYSTFDLTGDAAADLVVTVEPCAPLPTGDTEWRVFGGRGGGFDAVAASWGLPEMYGNDVAPLPFQGTSYPYSHCGNNWPAYSTVDLTGDLLPDLVVTLEPCAPLPTGDTEWHVFAGVCEP